jgi:hypothetical protein
MRISGGDAHASRGRSDERGCVQVGPKEDKKLLKQRTIAWDIPAYNAKK